jgi:hypothetical protein
MVTSLHKGFEANEIFVRLPAKVEELLKTKCGEAVRVTDGGNNLACRLKSDMGPIFVKSYFYDTHDQRNRLKAEFDMLSFLWKEGVRCIPEPLAADESERIGVYRCISGMLGRDVELEWDDVRQLADMLIEMWKLRTNLEAKKLEIASDSCISLADYQEAVDRRYRLLADFAYEDEAANTLSQFLGGPFTDLWKWLSESLRTGNESGRKMTLSPSDHGFHNAIRQPDGNWTFFDFEYAGWDDTAKMIADALHQPGVPIPIELHGRFVDYILAELNDDGSLLQRLHLVYPSVGMKWCLLMLNEFIPVSQSRRRYSGRTTSMDNRKTEQLKKAEEKLEAVKNEFIHGSF